MSNSNGGPSKKGAQKQSSKGKSSLSKMHPGNAGAEKMTRQMQQGGSGSPLDGGMKAQMESSFQTDFSGVRIHTDSNADQMNRSMKAKAFTRGEDVYFKKGEYDPSSQRGKQILGHELSHVVQQRQGRVQETTQAFGAPVNADPALEREADQQGIAAAEGKTAVAGSGGVAGGNAGGSQVIQREEDEPYTTSYNNTREEWLQEEQTNYQSDLAYSMYEKGHKYDWAPLTEDVFMKEVNLLKINVDAVYKIYETGFYTQMRAFKEAEDNMNSVLNYVNEKNAQTAALVSAFLTIAFTVGGGIFASSLGKVFGRIGGNKLGGYLKVSGDSLETMNKSFAGGALLATRMILASAIDPGSLSTGPLGKNTNGSHFSDAFSALSLVEIDGIVPPMAEIPKSNFSNAQAVMIDGMSAISAEKAFFAELIQSLTNNSEEAVENGIRPAWILQNFNDELARIQTEGKSASRGADTKLIEKEFWKVWFQQEGNGWHYEPQTVPVGLYSAKSGPDTKEYNNNKYIYEHLQNNLGVSEWEAKSWIDLSN